MGIAFSVKNLLSFEILENCVSPDYSERNLRNLRLLPSLLEGNKVDSTIAEEIQLKFDPDLISSLKKNMLEESGAISILAEKEKKWFCEQVENMEKEGIDLKSSIPKAMKIIERKWTEFKYFYQEWDSWKRGEELGERFRNYSSIAFSTWNHLEEEGRYARPDDDEKKEFEYSIPLVRGILSLVHSDAAKSPESNLFYGFWYFISNKRFLQDFFEIIRTFPEIQ